VRSLGLPWWCRVLACVWAGVSSLACWGTPVGVGADADASGTSTGSLTEGWSSSASATTLASSTSVSTTRSADDTRGTTTSNDSTGIPFLLEPDGLGPVFECDLFEQDCARGEKCTATGNDSVKCVPVVDDPVGPGEPCHVEDRWTSGLDDCELGALCLYVDHETLEGTCTPFCTGDPVDPYCEDPSRFCAISDSAPWIVCLLRCDPIEQDCSEDQACYPIQDEWACGFDASGEYGEYGDACFYINACHPGLVCLDESTVPPGQACEGAGGCCTELCDLSEPADDLQCAGAAGGQVCQPWYAAGAAPAGYENVGGCAVP